MAQSINGSGVTALTGAQIASGDVLPVIDISDTTEATTGTTKKGTAQEISGYVLQKSVANYAADAGSTDTYAITLSPVPSAYVTGMVVVFKANTINTGACSLTVNTLAQIAIKKDASSDLSNSDILAGQIVMVVYDGTNFQLIR